ncbi:hypothetical protein LX32DRAFT_277798 [Colletotrichum zoysiae]|uniref:Uncharacterized protein n=1 Tax=Colletotrichum zoysiae TaxID=1216348 RepID=A0AAD9H293_9PEZI|nr:hypothetical protein LX32DRAFT_277798 [Colletotrichum zoysiae]
MVWPAIFMRPCRGFWSFIFLHLASLGAESSPGDCIKRKAGIWFGSIPAALLIYRVQLHGPPVGCRWWIGGCHFAMGTTKSLTDRRPAMPMTFISRVTRTRSRFSSLPVCGPSHSLPVSNRWKLETSIKLC